ncbi:MAG: O-methyltransferase [Chitinophagaceae bacterium]
MYPNFQLAFNYLRYYLTSSNGKGHGVHSPFVFDFIAQVLNSKKHYYAYETVEALREKLKLDKEVLLINDLGAGSVVSAGDQRSIASIANIAAKPKKYGQLLFRIANYYQPDTILELGTSLGITTSYLALGNQHANIITLEGSVSIAEIALENFKTLQLKNTRLVQGNFDDTLKKVLTALSSVSMVFVDGNHRKEPTLRYFDQLLPFLNKESVIVFDDIHWSSEMTAAWKIISNHPKTMLTIDLFFIGLVFFNPAFKVKQNFSIRF